MVDEDESEDGELAVEGRNLAERALERRAEALESRGRAELVDLKLDLPRDELALEVCSTGASAGGQRATIDSSSIQCSCFPVRTWFSMASCEKGVWSSEDMFGSRRKAASAAGQVGGELGAGCNRSRRIFAEDESGGGDSCRSGGAGCEK